MLNALSLYIGVTRENIKITNFQKAVIEGLIEQETEIVENVSTQHSLEKTKIGRCELCYNSLSKTKGI